MKPITEFEVVDHGLKYSQYFQGCGIAFTEFTDIATGCGDNPAEAIDDALEMLAQNDWETEGMEKRICEDMGIKRIPNTPSSYKTDPSEDSELYYYVSIRVK